MEFNDFDHMNISEDVQSIVTCSYEKVLKSETGFLVERKSFENYQSYCILGKLFAASHLLYFGFPGLRSRILCLICQLPCNIFIAVSLWVSYASFQNVL